MVGPCDTFDCREKITQLRVKIPKKELGRGYSVMTLNSLLNESVSAANPPMTSRHSTISALMLYLYLE
jgi:hypothetical protein